MNEIKVEQLNDVATIQKGQLAALLLTFHETIMVQNGYELTHQEREKLTLQSLSFVFGRVTEEAVNEKKSW